MDRNRVATDLEKEHQSEAGEEWFVDSGINVLSPGGGQSHIKHIHVSLNLFEELDRVLFPPEPGQACFSLLKLSL